MFFIISHLDFPTASCFIDGTLHRLSHVSAYMMTCPSLLRQHDQWSGSSHARYEGIPSLSASRIATRLTSGTSIPSRRRLIPTKTSKTLQTQVTDNLRPFQGLDIRVHVFDLDAHFFEIVGQVFCHFLSQSGNKGPSHSFQHGH